MMKQIGIVGTGFMGTAVMRAIRGTNSDVQFGTVEKDGVRRENARQEFGALDFSAHPGELFGFAEAVFLAVKPQDLALFAASIGTAARKSLIVSMLAGTSIDSIQTAVGASRVVRIMPNLAAGIGKAVTGISFATGLVSEDRSAVRELLEGIGTLVEVEEQLLGAITGISGSGIAFVFRFIEALAMAGVEQGIPFAQSLRAARDVVESAALLLRSTEEHPAEMISRVCSPGGTTIKGMRALEDHGFAPAVMAAVEAATARAIEFESTL